MITSISLVAEFGDSLLPERSVELCCEWYSGSGERFPIPRLSRYRPEGVFE